MVFNYYEKYIKYKTKYLKLRKEVLSNQRGGGRREGEEGRTECSKYWFLKLCGRSGQSRAGCHCCCSYGRC